MWISYFKKLFKQSLNKMKSFKNSATNFEFKLELRLEGHINFKGHALKHQYNVFFVAR